MSKTSCRVLMMFLVVVLAGIPCLAQGAGRTCEPTGTWLGGSDPSGIPGYQMTVTREAAGRYLVVYQSVYDPGTHVTVWTGELRKENAQIYSQYAASTAFINQDLADFYLQNFGIQVAPGSIEVDGIYTQVVMLDCNTIQSTISWFGWYVPITADKVPFVTLPEIEFIRDVLGGQPIVEIYHRVGPDCPICGSPGKAASRGSVNKKAVPKWHSR